MLFDVDGTLVDSLHVIVGALGDTFEKYAGIRPSDEEITSLIGMPLHKQLLLFQDSPPSEERLSEMIDFTIHRFDANVSEEVTFEESIEALRMCHQARLKIALVTSKNAIELESFLKRFVCADVVETTVCASDVHQPKPNPESALLACARLGVEPSEAVMIGDSVYDIRCALEAGVTPIAVGYGASDRSTLLAESPAAFFERPSDLLEWVRDSLLETSCQERK